MTSILDTLKSSTSSQKVSEWQQTVCAGKLLDDGHSTSTTSPSPMMLDKETIRQRYRNCYYQHGRFCCSKICTMVVLLLFTTVIALISSILAMSMDNWAGVSTNPNATLDLPYPRLGPNHLDYIMFNKTIPNDKGTLYKYIDQADTPSRAIISRFGLFSQCKKPTGGPRIDLLKTPWKAPVCQASASQYQCPIVAIRTAPGEPPSTPGGYRFSKFNGCIDSSQRCDGVLDCPSGHDEVGCPIPNRGCGEGMVMCSAEKPLCIHKSLVCNGINDCGMFEDERHCCGKTSFLRCGDGSCLMGERCDAKADCLDLSDEYECPTPSSDAYTTCTDGQLIKSKYKCEQNGLLSFHCKDLSDETDCEFDSQPTAENPAIRTMTYKADEQCFQQTFTFQSLNDSMLQANYHDRKQREFVKTYEFSALKMAVIVSIFIEIFIALICIALLLCMGRVTKRCKPMRYTFIIMSILYSLCLLITVLVGLFWINYSKSLNNVMENPAESDIYEEVIIETIKVTGGLATIRISTQLTFYKTGFYALATILAVTAACLLKRASCHTQESANNDYIIQKGSLYSDEIAGLTDVLLPVGSQRPRADSFLRGVPPAPDHLITPQDTLRAASSGLSHSQSDSVLKPAVHYNSSYRPAMDNVDSLSSDYRLSPASASRRTFGRGSETQV